MFYKYKIVDYYRPAQRLCFQAKLSNKPKFSSALNNSSITSLSRIQIKLMVYNIVQSCNLLCQHLMNCWKQPFQQIQTSLYTNFIRTIRGPDIRKSRAGRRPAIPRAGRTLGRPGLPYLSCHLTTNNCSKKCQNQLHAYS